jgi:Fe-S cluster biogenesis protein NfuA
MLSKSTMFISACRSAARSSAPRTLATATATAPLCRSLHRLSTTASSSLTSTATKYRPHAPSLGKNSRFPPGTRSIFIQTEDTPNADALKFIPNSRILPENFPSSFLEYLSPRSTLAPPYPSPLAAQLLNVDGVSSVFYGPDYITVTKDSATPWPHVKPEVFSLITEAVTSGQALVNTVSGGGKNGEQGEQGIEKDSLEFDENDSEVVSMIKELLETRIRPAIQEDGGDIEFRGFVDGQVLLKLRGACRTCDSSTVTLKTGIESMLMHYIGMFLSFFSSLFFSLFPPLFFSFCLFGKKC